MRGYVLVLTALLAPSIAFAGEDYPNEDLLLERMTLACPDALNLVKVGSRFFYKLAEGGSSIQVEECFSKIIDEHLENPWPVDSAKDAATAVLKDAKSF